MSTIRATDPLPVALPLRGALDRARSAMLRTQNDDKVRRWCRWIMRRLIRACLALTGPAPTPESDEALYARFARHYPAATTRDLRQAILWSQEPTAHIGRLLPFLKSFGRWVVREIERHPNVSPFS